MSARRAIAVAGSVASAAIAALGLWPTHVDGGVVGLARPVLRGIAEATGGTTLTLSMLESLNNVLFFVPFGLFGALLVGARFGWLAAPAGLAVSLAIEGAQALLLADRTADPRDIVANAIGATLGAAIALLALQVRARRRAQIRPSTAASARTVSETNA